MLVSQQDAIELLRGNPALFQAQNDLTRAQATIDENLPVIGRDQRAVPRAAAAKHGETEHARYLADAFTLHKRKSLQQQGWLFELAIAQGENPLPFLGAVIERTKNADFFEAAQTVQCVEIFRVTRCQSRRLQITPTQISVAECVRASSGK